MNMLKPERIGLDDFADQSVNICGKAFLAHKFGALYWPAEKALIVSDLHLEKGSAFAARGQMLPPYDTRETLNKWLGIFADQGLISWNDSRVAVLDADRKLERHCQANFDRLDSGGCRGGGQQQLSGLVLC